MSWRRRARSPSPTRRKRPTSTSQARPARTWRPSFASLRCSSPRKTRKRAWPPSPRSASPSSEDAESRKDAASLGRRPMHDALTIAGREFGSRLLLGTGKYDSFETMRDAVVTSGAEIVTVAVRRIDFEAAGEDITSFLPEGVLLLPNTSG